MGCDYLINSDTLKRSLMSPAKQLLIVLQGVFLLFVKKYFKVEQTSVLCLMNTITQVMRCTF